MMYPISTELLGLLDTCLTYFETKLTINKMISFETKALRFDLEKYRENQNSSFL